MNHLKIVDIEFAEYTCINYCGRCLATGMCRAFLYGK